MRVMLFFIAIFIMSLKTVLQNIQNLQSFSPRWHTVQIKWCTYILMFQACIKRRLIYPDIFR